ncbi:MAG: helix-turn-helix, AraC type [Osedax symbiont Rs2]|nr:MAG: helix-turn-helix, AraC type [Osedax symbiont Rs2]
MRSKPVRPLNFEQSNTDCLRTKSLTKSLSWAHYQNDNDNLYYQNNKKHTLSMYLDGGFETFRTDRPNQFGFPGSFCLMPKESQSHWQVGMQQQFMHLYFDDNYLKQLALKTFDIDPRTLELPELTFFENPALEAIYRHQIAASDWSVGADQLLLEQVTNTVLVTMIHALARKKLNVKGGLAPKVLLQVCDFMQSNFSRQIFLAELAAIGQLSEYHFCRMFKLSTAQTPQEFLLNIRIERVKQQCRNTKLKLSEIALCCGFSNQSHMGRSFKRVVGATPSQYRKQLLGTA